MKVEYEIPKTGAKGTVTVTAETKAEAGQKVRAMFPKQKVNIKDIK